ncbi:hypothetical protein BDR04DRAFT_1016870, partial [Suillus decipiens]
LPSGTLTLQSTSTGNWTCPNNVFGTEGIIDAMISCSTEPAKWGPKTDHLPILIVFKLEVSQMDDTPCLNWHEVDWEHFKEVLEMALVLALPLPLISADEFQIMA